MEIKTTTLPYEHEIQFNKTCLFKVIWKIVPIGFVFGNKLKKNK